MLTQKSFSLVLPNFISYLQSGFKKQQKNKHNKVPDHTESSIPDRIQYPNWKIHQNWCKTLCVFVIKYPSHFPTEGLWFETELSDRSGTSSSAVYLPSRIWGVQPTHSRICVTLISWGGYEWFFRHTMSNRLLVSDYTFALTFRSAVIISLVHSLPALVMSPNCEKFGKSKEQFPKDIFGHL